MYDQLTGPPPEYEFSCEERCPECGSDDLSHPHYRKVRCNDCGYGGTETEFNHEINLGRSECKKGEG